MSCQAPVTHDVRAVPSRLLERLALHKVSPAYPPLSRNLGQGGTVVADLRVSQNGLVRHLAILESPNTELASAVETALRQWTFPAAAGPELSGTLAFYFDATLGGVVHINDRPVTVDTRTNSSQSPPSRPRRETVAVASLDRLALEPGRIVLDIRDRTSFRRSRRHGRVNIPLAELAERAPRELSSFVSVGLDCEPERLTECDRAAEILTSAGFGDVTVYVR